MTVSVAVRLGLEGGQAATRGIEDFGAKGQRSFREIRKEAAALPPHLVAVSRGVGAVKDKVSELATGTGVINDLAGSFGGYGMAVAAASAVVTGAVVALNQAALAAIEFGDEIDGAAQRAGVNTDTLQELRYAVKMMGGEYADADSAIGAFTKNLGLAESGNAKALKSFRQLGFTQDELKSFRTADEALMAVASRVAELDKETERQAIADKLGISGLVPILREGTGKLAELRTEAHQVGVVSQDVTKRAGELQDQLDKLSIKTMTTVNGQMIEAGNLSVALASGLGEAKIAGANFFKELSDGLPVIDEFIRKSPILQKWGELLKLSWNVTPFPWIGRGVRALGAPTRARDLGSSIQAMLGGGLGRMVERDGQWVSADAVQPSPATGGGRHLLSVSGGGGGGASASAEAAKAKRELEQARKEAEKLELATRQAAGAALEYADATAKSAAEAAGDASTVDYLDRVRSYYADLNGLLKAGVELLEAKALVQERILAQARAEATARSNPEGFKSAAQRMSEAVGDAVITAPQMDFDWLRVGAGDAFHDGLMDAANGGDFFQTFEARLRNAAAAALAGQLTDAVFGKSSGGSGGGWFDKLLGSAASAIGKSFGSGSTPAATPSSGKMFGPARAAGGPVYRGDVRPIDEYGIERFARYSGDGYMVDAARTAQEIRDSAMSARSAYGSAGASSSGPIAVALNNQSSTPLQATAREASDGAGGRRVEIDLTDLIDSRVARGQRQMFDGSFDTPFQRAFGVRRRLNGG